MSLGERVLKRFVFALVFVCLVSYIAIFRTNFYWTHTPLGKVTKQILLFKESFYKNLELRYPKKDTETLSQLFKTLHDFRLRNATWAGNVTSFNSLFSTGRLPNFCPYTPVDKLIQKTQSNLSQVTSQDIIQFGVGMEPIVTEKGEKTWSENSVEYRPFPFLESNFSEFYSAEYEAYIPFKAETFFLGHLPPQQKSGQKKIILWWQHKHHQEQISRLTPLRGCPDFPCEVTSNRLYTSQSAAMLINGQFVKKEGPPRRRADQVLVYYLIEAPSPKFWFFGSFLKAVPAWESAFNWTMSYRMDSDIMTYYGLVRRRRQPRVRDYSAILSAKRGKVAWMVSSCHANSKRMAYVRILQRYIPVDIYGGCGYFKCPRGGDKQCLKHIGSQYKFYLGFENNLCRDYITEKFFRFVIGDLVLVARGYNDYHKLAPPDIFINTADFKSPKELAQRLLYLDSHDDEYIAMLKRQDEYFTAFEDYPLRNIHPMFLEYRYEAVPLCELCHRIWNLDHYSKTISNISAWHYDPKYQCYPPRDLGGFDFLSDIDTISEQIDPSH